MLDFFLALIAIYGVGKDCNCPGAVELSWIGLQSVARPPRLWLVYPGPLRHLMGRLRPLSAGHGIRKAAERSRPSPASAFKVPHQGPCRPRPTRGVVDSITVGRGKVDLHFSRRVLIRLCKLSILVRNRLLSSHQNLPGNYAIS
ncbi:hypothetical protein LY76DRAFT_212347 [Colletotrichum caudatum]|nr:hypothetical protein LY76DRAFT_212347 [Colletotrichum caudatum]